MSAQAVSQLGPPLLGADEVASHLGCSVELVYKLRRQGRLKAVRIGSVFRWRPSVVEAFVKASEE